MNFYVQNDASMQPYDLMTSYANFSRIQGLFYTCVYSAGTMSSSSSITATTLLLSTEVEAKSEVEDKGYLQHKCLHSRSLELGQIYAEQPELLRRGVRRAAQYGARHKPGQSGLLADR